MTTTVPASVPLYDVFAEDGTFLMRAPLSTVSSVYRLQRPAEERVLRESGRPGGCLLHSSGRADWTSISVVSCDITLGTEWVL